MSHRGCPDCGAWAWQVFPIGSPDATYAMFKCVGCRALWKIDKHEVIAQRIARMPSGPGPDEKGELFKSPETAVFLTCPKCHDPLPFTGVSLEGYALPASAVVFTCPAHGNFTLSTMRGFVTGL